MKFEHSLSPKYALKINISCLQSRKKRKEIWTVFWMSALYSNSKENKGVVNGVSETLWKGETAKRFFLRAWHISTSTITRPKLQSALNASSSCSDAEKKNKLTNKSILWDSFVKKLRLGGAHSCWKHETVRPLKFDENKFWETGSLLDFCSVEGGTKK